MRSDKSALEQFVDASQRARWLPDARLRERTATRPTRARFDWEDGAPVGAGGSRVHVTFLAKGDARSTIALEHRRLADAAQAQELKTYWRARVAALMRVAPARRRRRTDRDGQAGAVAVRLAGPVRGRAVEPSQNRSAPAQGRFARGRSGTEVA